MCWMKSSSSGYEAQDNRMSGWVQWLGPEIYSCAEHGPKRCAYKSAHETAIFHAEHDPHCQPEHGIIQPADSAADSHPVSATHASPQ
jgi:hypothetical protein